MFVDEHRARFGVEPICRELEVSARAYRQRRAAPPSARAQSDAVLLAEIRRIHSETDESYGAWRCWRQLRKDGFCVARCTVERLMRGAGLVGVRRGLTRRTTIPHRQPVAGSDLVRRRFQASRPDELWVCDFTYVRTWQGWAYLAIVLDVYSRRIVGWQLAPHMRDRLVDDALADGDRQPKAARRAARCAHRQRLAIHVVGVHPATADAGIAPSRGRTGTALDNAMAESVIATIKTELITRRPWPTRLDLELALLGWIGFYNERRIHRSLGGQTPQEVTDQYHQNHGTDTQKTT